MRATLFTVLSMAASSALAIPFFSSSNGIAKRCDAVEVKFHYNDTTIGTVKSCTTDVMYRGDSPSNERRTDEYETYDTYDNKTTGCIDGPLTNYTVVSGDTLEKIAAEYNSGVCNIADLNNLDDPDYILVGQALSIPTNVCTADNDSCRTVQGEATCVAADAGVASTYTIVSGDTFFAIASSLGITLDSLVAANPDADAGNLQIGQVINIPICDE